jgi:hypothetical protein
MKTYKVELRHAPSKNRLNAFDNNRLDPLTARLEGDEEAIRWAREELVRMFGRKAGPDYGYVEAAVWELLPIRAGASEDENRRLGRWVGNADGLIWRPRPEGEASEG